MPQGVWYSRIFECLRNGYYDSKSCEHFQPIHIEFQQYLVIKLMVLAVREWLSAAAGGRGARDFHGVTTANHG